MYQINFKYFITYYSMYKQENFKKELKNYDVNKVVPS